MDIVGKPPLFSNLEEQARAHSLAKYDIQQLQRIPIRVEVRKAGKRQTEMRLLGFLVLQTNARDRPGCRWLPGSGGRSRPFSQMALDFVAYFVVPQSPGHAHDDIRR